MSASLLHKLTALSSFTLNSIILTDETSRSFMNEVLSSRTFYEELHLVV